MKKHTALMKISIFIAGITILLQACSQPVALRDEYAETNGIRIHYVTAGSGKLMIFLHGFPEFWYQWKPQLEELGKDYQVVAPDMRGYNLSAKPEGIEPYQIDHLVEDVRALAQHLGRKKIILVGQDWGGVIAWAFALYHPDYVEKLIILNAPHPAIFDRELKQNAAQQAASAYMLAIRDDKTEQALADHNYAALQQSVLAEGLQNGRLSPADRDLYLQAWAQPGALRSALNYYRAARIGPPDSARKIGANGNYTPALHSTIVHVPTLLIWGLKDPYLLSGNLSGIAAYVPELTLKLMPDASHWINREKPEEVNALIRDFIKASN